MITYATVCSAEMPVSGFWTDIGTFLLKMRMNKKEISMIKKIAAVMLSVCMSTTMAAGVQAADFTSGEETLEGMFTDGGKADQTGDISEIANDIVAQAEEKAQEYQKLKEEADRAAAKKAAEEKARKAEEERVAHRQEIVDFAMQFEGKPYVYGGTSLTNGADCSGFMMSVFKEFGYELPRVAAAQYESSQKKEISDIEVGDLVFYGSNIYHVGLYIGDEKIIHASTSASGIKVSDYDFETPSGVGTYLK